jgi:hypothetical protein
MGSGAGGMTVWGIVRGSGTSTHLTGLHQLTIALVDAAAIRAAVTRALAAR